MIIRGAYLWGALLAAMPLALGALAVRAAPDVILSGTATSMADERRALNEARVQAREAQARSRALEVQASAAMLEADRARARAAALAARIQQTEAEIRASDARIAIIGKLQQQQITRLAARQEPAARLIAALQVAARRPAILTLIESGSLRETVHVRTALAAAAPVIEQRSAGLRADIAQSRKLRLAAEQVGRARRTARAQLADQHLQLRQLEAARRLAARGFSSGATMESDRATALGERARDITELMEKLEDAGDIRERLASLPGPVPRPVQPGSAALPASDRIATRPANPPYRLPVLGSIVTGMGELSQSGVRSRGLTIAASSGAQVIAPASGHIAFAGEYRGFGKIVIIDHGKGWTSLITDMADLSVAVGDSVAQGEPLGRAGDNRPKVTVELRRHGRPIDIVALIASG